MKSTHTALALLSAVILVLAASIAVPRGTPAADREVARIQAHLERVERELLARDVSHFTPAQRAARSRNIRILREYRERGIFPHGGGFAGERGPYAADAHGTLCALAYLIARSGRQDLVSHIAAMRNDAHVSELAADPGLAVWLEEAGLTLDEVARIQPSYEGCGALADRVSAAAANGAIAGT